MSMDQNNRYEFAGPGHKRRARERLTLDTITKKIAKPEYRLNRKPAKEEMVPITIRARDIKRKIIKLTLQLDSFTDIYRRLDREGYGAGSKVLVASVRNSEMEVMRVMKDEGLIDDDTLARYWTRCAKRYRARFKRRDDADD